MGVARVDRGAYLHDRAGDRLDHPPLAPPLAYREGLRVGRSADGGRFVLGVASGDRPVEFPAFGIDWHRRDVLFRENLAEIRRVLAEEFPSIQSSYGTLVGTADLVPKPIYRLPILVTGSSRQGFEWIAAHADGWITYPRDLARQAELVAKWRAAVAVASPGVFKPFVQSLYIDLADGRRNRRGPFISDLGPAATSCSIS